MILRAVAHSRAGDKGNLVTISVIAYRDEDYPMLQQRVTEERVQALFHEHLDQQLDTPVVRYCVPNLCALNFVLHRPLTESVTRSLRIDAHGKALSSLMLSLEL